MHGLHKFLLFHVLTSLGQNGHGSEIIHGHKVPANSMLYMVSVQNNKGHVCGGFLVREDFVITAAHCDKDKPTSVFLGSHNLKEGEKMIHIDHKHYPKTYVNERQGDDIMLLKLSRKAQLNTKIQKINLPKSTHINIKENEPCVVAGWGKTESDNFVDELRMVNVSVINPRVCKEKCPGLPSNVICAGGYNTTKGFCEGDYGGPLVCSGIAVGVVSFNSNCDYPDVYTDLSKYREWIDKVMKLHANI